MAKLPIEKIRHYYTIVQQGDTAIALNGKRFPAAANMPVILTFGIQGLTSLEDLALPEWKQRLEKGDIVKTTGLDLVAGILGWDDDRVFDHTHCGQDRRTVNFIESFKITHGIIERKDYSDEDVPVLESSRLVREGIHQCANLGQIDGQWVYEINVQYEIDCFASTHYSFDHLPTEKDIDVASMIENFEHYFVFKPMRFSCWECGKETHWLDTPGDLRDKINNHREKYCGC